MSKSWEVIIEWDGGVPPTKWYNRLRRLGLHVQAGIKNPGRDDEAQSPLIRRESDAGVIHQEGAILVKTETHARLLGHLAYQLGAKAVSIGIFEAVELEMTAEDQRVLERVQTTLGKRGRPEAASYWVITCLDEMKSYNYTGLYPVNCRNCGSFHLHVREGNLVVCQPKGVQLIDKWTNARFSSGSWEESILMDSAESICEVEPESLKSEDHKKLEVLINSTLYVQIIDALSKGWIDEAKALKYLDYGFSVLSQDDETRLRNRLDGFAAWIKAGGKQNGLNLVISPKRVDALDIFKWDSLVIKRLPVIVE